MTSKNSTPAARKDPPYANDEGEFSHPMLEKIRKLLTSTDPDKWGIGGEDLTPALRFERPRSSHQQVLVRELPNGSLVLHAVQPIECHYGPGGYSAEPNGAAIYTVEVRDRIFDPNKLVDPKFSANFQGKRCDVIASGNIAKSLFLQVKGTIQSLVRERQKHFNAAVAKLEGELLARIENTKFEDWTKTIEQKDELVITSYAITLDEIRIVLSKEINGLEETLSATLSQGQLHSSRVPQRTIRDAIKRLSEMEQEAQLQKLDSVLKELGFE